MSIYVSKYFNFLFWILLLIFHTNMVSAESLDKIENDLVIYFESRCKIGGNLESRLSWPVGFEHPTDKVACEFLNQLGKSTDSEASFLFNSAYSLHMKEYSRVESEVDEKYFSELALFLFFTVQHYILRLDIAVNHPIGMTNANSRDQLTHHILA